MLALGGIKVLDTTGFIPGQYCTMFLGDMGADVIKIERPPSEEKLTPRLEARIGGARRLERNKRSIALDLRSEEGREVFYRMARGADVILEGFRPGVVKRLGIDYDTIQKMSPRIVYCSLSGFGQSGPYRDLVGFDGTYISIAGALGVIADKNGFPVKPGNYLGDMGGGLHAALGIVIALLARERTGKGQYVDVAMTDAVLSLLAQEFSISWYSGRYTPPGDYGISPDSNIYETKDGKYITISAILPRFWANLCKILGCEDLIPYASATGEKREEIFNRFREIFRTKTRDEWFDLLSQSEVSVAKVNSLEEVCSDPQILHRNMIVEVTDPTTGKKEKHVGIAIKLSETPGSIRSLAPEIGHHTHEILKELGYAEEEVDRLYRSKAVA